MECISPPAKGATPLGSPGATLELRSQQVQRNPQAITTAFYQCHPPFDIYSNLLVDWIHQLLESGDLAQDVVPKMPFVLAADHST